MSEPRPKSSECNRSLTKVFLTEIAISRNVMRLRKKKKLTQTELADRAKLARRTINEVESGRKNGTSVRTLVQLAAALEVTVTDLLIVRNGGKGGSKGGSLGTSGAAAPSSVAAAPTTIDAPAKGKTKAATA